MFWPRTWSLRLGVISPYKLLYTLHASPHIMILPAEIYHQGQESRAAFCYVLIYKYLFCVKPNILFRRLKVQMKKTWKNIRNWFRDVSVTVSHLFSSSNKTISEHQVCKGEFSGESYLYVPITDSMMLKDRILNC